MSAKKLGFGLMRLPSLDPNDPSATGTAFQAQQLKLARKLLALT